MMAEGSIPIKDNFSDKVKKVKSKFAIKQAKELLVKYRVKFNTLTKREYVSSFILKSSIKINQDFHPYLKKKPKKLIIYDNLR